VELIAARTAMAIDNARLYRRVVKQNRTLRTLAAIAQEFSSILDVDPLLRKLAEQLRQLINYDALSILLLEPAEAMLKDYLSIRYDQRVRLDNIPLGQGIVGAAAESRQPVLVPDTGKDPRYIACSAGIRSEVAVPLLAGSRVIGVLDLESEHLHFFTEDHVRTLSLLAPQVATAIENARLYQRVAQNEARLEADLEAARQLQQHLLPAGFPQVEGLEIAARCEPARQIGGDLYDFITFSDRRPGIVVGDVSGKGAAAALYASLVTGQLRLLAPEHPSPASLMQALNRTLLDIKSACLTSLPREGRVSHGQAELSYLTLICARWHADSQTLVVANAGMPLPILLSRGKAAEQNVVGIPLGLLGDTQYEEVSLPLQSGDAVVFSSDGIIDNRDHAGEDYGRDRLARLIERHGRRPAGELLQRIFHDVEKHAAGRRAFDDQTAVVVKRIS